MKGYMKAMATFLVLLGAFVVIGIILCFLFPDADHEKMGVSLAVLAAAIAFGVAIKERLGKKKFKGEILILAVFVFVFISITLSSKLSNKSGRNDTTSKRRINTYAQELISMAGRAKKYADPNTMAFVIFEKDDIFVQAATLGTGISFIDLPVTIMRDDRVEILNGIFPSVHKNYVSYPNGQIELVSYQIYFEDSDTNIHKAAAAIDVIFLKVFGLSSDYGGIKIKKETD